jgi:tRNA U38,U39,U40 pseudouridine synthase TruA
VYSSFSRHYAVSGCSASLHRSSYSSLRQRPQRLRHVLRDVSRHLLRNVAAVSLLHHLSHFHARTLASAADYLYVMKHSAFYYVYYITCFGNPYVTDRGMYHRVQIDCFLNLSVKVRGVRGRGRTWLGTRGASFSYIPMHCLSKYM